MPPSSRGLGHFPFTEVTGIRIPLGVLNILSFYIFNQPVKQFLIRGIKILTSIGQRALWKLNLFTLVLNNSNNECIF